MHQKVRVFAAFLFGGDMLGTVLEKAATVQYWDGNAKWHKLWVEHNNYHDEIIRTLTSFVKPGWRVLDIGAGNGILSLPLSAVGCKVTALEPSCGMRELLWQEATARGIASLQMEARRWEDMPLNELMDYDLIVASNSLHLTETGFMSALKKIFLAGPRHAFIISEKQFPDSSAEDVCCGYTRFFEEQYGTESSYAYHCIDDAFEHWSFKHERQPDHSERLSIMSGLIYENGHLWRKGNAIVGMCWWTRNKLSEIPNSDITFHPELATTDVYISNQTNRALA